MAGKASCRIAPIFSRLTSQCGRFPKLPVDILLEIGKRLAPEDLCHLLATCKELEVFRDPQLNCRLFRHLRYGKYGWDHLFKESTSPDTLEEVLAQLNITVDRGITSWHDLVNLITPTNNNWALPRFEIQTQIFFSPRDFRRGSGATFKLDTQHRFWLIYLSASQLGKVLYLHHQKTDKWWAQELDLYSYFDCQGDLVAISHGTCTTNKIQVNIWKFEDIAEEHFRSPQSQEIGYPSRKNSRCPDAWHSVDGIHASTFSKFDQPCNLLNYHGTIDLQLPESADICQVTLLLPYLYIGMRNRQCLMTVKMFDTSTLQPLQNVKPFHTPVGSVFFERRWAMTIQHVDDGYILQFWNTFDNKYLQQHLSKIPGNNHYKYPCVLKGAYHDPETDMMVFAYNEILFLVPDFEKEVVTGNNDLNDCIQFIDFRPSNSNIRISVCFADGRVVVALNQAYPHYSESKTSIYYLTATLLTIDLRNWHDRVNGFPFLQIQMLAPATAGIDSMEMDWESVYCHTLPNFHDKKYANIIKAFAICNSNNIRQHFPEGIHWKKHNGEKSLAYQHCLKQESLTNVHMSTITAFLNKHQTEWHQNKGIASFKF